MLMIKYSHLRVENDPQKVKCYDEEEYIHPPDQQREDGGENLHQECVEGSLRAVN